MLIKTVLIEDVYMYVPAVLQSWYSYMHCHEVRLIISCAQGCVHGSHASHAAVCKAAHIIVTTTTNQANHSTHRGARDHALDLAHHTAGSAACASASAGTHCPGAVLVVVVVVPVVASLLHAVPQYKSDTCVCKGTRCPFGCRS